MTALLARYRGTIAAIVNGIAGVLVGPTTITTSTASTATAYSNQRKVDRCQNGVLWAAITKSSSSSNDLYAWYSTDNGSTWTQDATLINSPANNNYVANHSFFIDLDDYAHVVYKSGADGYIYYRRGTPNAGRTAWTWSAATSVYAATDGDYPDIVAHREGTGWAAHIVISRSTGTAHAWRLRVDITSGGAISTAASASISGTTSANSNHGFPSIDFNHTGDGKTVAGGAPHLYVAWSRGATGAGEGIRFMKATYSGGTWTWGTEREIDSTRYVASVAYWLNCIFDGTRVTIVGCVFDGTNGDVILHERDAADTTTTTRALIDNALSSTILTYGSGTYDGEGNVYLFGLNEDEASGSRDLVYRKWTRATTTLGSEVVIDSAASNTPYISAKRGYSDSTIEWIYTDGTSSPYNVNFGSLR